MSTPDPGKLGDEARALARGVVRRWRALTGGSRVRDDDRRTLVACSGGADSVCLAICLASGSDGLVLGHVRHDLRDEAETARERDSVRQLAGRLGLLFAERSVRATGLAGNWESNARRVRYGALEEMAVGHACPFIATGHQANDQVETMLMALARGAGPRGLAGVPAVRRVGRGEIRVVRPQLHLVRAQCELICRDARVPWAEDSTNADVGRLRAALRRGVASELLAIRPALASRALDAASLLRGAADVIDERAVALCASATRSGDRLVWGRDALRAERHDVVVAGALRRAHVAFVGRGDRLSYRQAMQAARAIRSSSNEVRSFAWAGAVLRVDGREVVLTAMLGRSGAHHGVDA